MVVSYLYGQKHYPIPYNITVCISIILASVVLWQVSNYILISFNAGMMMSVLIKLIALSIFTMFAWTLLKPSSTVELVEEQ